MRRLTAIVLLATLWSAGPVKALHETDHRYDLTGYVLDADERPLSGVPVVGHLDGEPIGRGRSDANGHYRFRMHLHDSDRGRELRVKTPDAEGTVRVTLTPGDRSTERIHHVNFVGGRLVEGELGARTGAVSPAVVIAGAAAVALVGTYFATGRIRRARKRRMRAEQQAAKGQTRRASRRRRRGKRRK